jgi:hypothetical protein
MHELLVMKNAMSVISEKANGNIFLNYNGF